MPKENRQYYGRNEFPWEVLQCEIIPLSLVRTEITASPALQQSGKRVKFTQIEWHKKIVLKGKEGSHKIPIHWASENSFSMEIHSNR